MRATRFSVAVAVLCACGLSLTATRARAQWGAPLARPKSEAPPAPPAPPAPTNTTPTDAASPPATPPPATAAPAATTPPAPPAAPAPVAAPPTAASTAPVAAPPPARHIASSAAACVVGDHDGVPEPDARTTAALVCEALLDAGARIEPQPIGASDAVHHGSAYRIDMRPLGKLVMLQVSFESPIGMRLRSRSLQLAKIEEVPVAALRIADALVHNKPLEGTARVDRLVGQETRKYEKQYGETLFAFGVFGMAIIDDTTAGYGAFGRLYYEATHYAVGADLRVGGSGRTDGDASLVGISVGGRYFLNTGDITPFLGGGVGILWLGTQSPGAIDPDDPYPYDYDYRDWDGTGASLYGEFGVEFLRLHGSRFDAALRPEFPLFELKDSGSGRYALPILLTVSYSFG
jgi:hypothetical protein